MKTYPLYSRTFEEARELQFKVIDAAAHHFTGEQSLDLGDLGVHKGTNRPLQTIRVEHVFADAFDAEDAVLVRGAGTGALRWALVAAVDPGATVLVHDAPIYPTTKVTLDTMGARTAVADFNDDASIARVCAEHASEITGVLIQHSRQKPDDSYELGHVIEQVRAALGDVHIVTDDNYAATKVKAIGNQLGADLATFSCFKLLGPEGVGVVLGSRPLVEKIREMQYSGGSQVQGHEAMAALRGLIYAPVALSITGTTCTRWRAASARASCRTSRAPMWQTPRARPFSWSLTRTSPIACWSSRPPTAPRPTPWAVRASTSSFPCSTASAPPSAQRTQPGSVA